MMSAVAAVATEARAGQKRPRSPVSVPMAALPMTKSNHHAATSGKLMVSPDKKQQQPERRFHCQKHLQVSAAPSVLSTALLQRVVVSARSCPRDHRDQVPTGTHPHDYLLKMLENEHGIKVSVCGVDEIQKDFFDAPTPEHIAAYGTDVINAVRLADMPQLRKFHQEGRVLQCSNQFGESLLHLACRKQLVEVVDFLINEAHVSVQIKDDYGRTPLSDAFWTADPNFALVDLIVKKCPDLLYIRDRRGFTPLFYARKCHWAQWITHLSKCATELAPRSLVHA